MRRHPKREIYKTAASLLDTVEKRPIRLVGIGLSGFSDSDFRQLSLDDMFDIGKEKRKKALDNTLLELQRRYGGEIIKTGDELIAEKRFGIEKKDKELKDFLSSHVCADAEYKLYPCRQAHSLCPAYIGDTI